ncbi:MAG: prolyl oligopeptidase family serine peptidase [Planctomycetota bacterium]
MRCSLLVMIAVFARTVAAQETEPFYQQPSPAILAVLRAPPPPMVSLSPTRDLLLLSQMERYPPIADLAQELVPLAGLRINPKTNALGSIGNMDWRPYATLLKLKRIADGSEIVLPLPPAPRVMLLSFSADGARFAFSNLVEDGLELWLAETATGKTQRVAGVHLNDVLGAAVDWLADQHTLLVKLVPDQRRAPAPRSPVPRGPNIEETKGKSASSTYEARDVLKSADDEELFESYATSQLALVDAVTGAVHPFAAPALYRRVQPSPSGELILVERVHRPFSHLHAENRFPVDLEVISLAGEPRYTLARIPLADQVPIDGVPTGPRACTWCPTEPATLLWLEALDGGDPKNQVPHRDRVLVQAAPFLSGAVELCRTEHRCTGVQWLAGRTMALVNELDRDRRWRRTFLIDTKDPGASLRLVWDRSASERYKDPGNPLLITLRNGQSVVQQIGDAILLAGNGASPEGDRPFLDRLDLKTLTTERWFRCDRESYESVAAVLGDGTQFITVRESPREPPNYFVRTIDAAVAGAAEGEAVRHSTPRAVTSFADPAPALRGIDKRLVKHARADGVQISMNVYLPPGHQQGTRLPTVLYAYPLEHSDPTLASQVLGSEQRFTTITGASHLFFLLAGYAVLEPTMPCVGPPASVYDTFVEQLVANSRAAIEKAVEMGVTDPERVGVIGHSHGALMAADLLAHCDLFRAGIARSGAHNKTLTAFGFQTEHRTLWEATDTYLKVSPLFRADKIKAPLLLIHGERDANPGTVPMQSERLYEAVRGNGGTARLVMLPLESHAYVARESVEHTIYEMISWFDRYVKTAKPRSSAGD